jgi:hypothetical protein
MSTNISVKTKIRVNGQDYGSVNDMPPEVRQAYEEALAVMRGAKHGRFLDKLGSGMRANVQMVSNAKVVFNGQEYAGVEQMPAKVRQLYQAVMAAVESGGTPVAPEIGGTVQAMPPNTGTSAPFPTFPTTSVHLETTNWKLLLVTAVILLLAWLGFGKFVIPP